MTGGFSRNRVIGDVSSQSFSHYGGQDPGGSLYIGMQDISLGVATGGSPMELYTEEWSSESVQLQYIGPSNSGIKSRSSIPLSAP